MNWHKRKHDPVGLGAKFWTDWVDDDEEFTCAQGMDEYERERWKPWALLYRKNHTLIKIGCFATLQEAQQAAEEL